MKMIQVHADIGMVYCFVDLILFLINAQMLALITGVRLDVYQLFTS